MRNYKGPFQRTGEISREPNQCSDWLESFAEKLAIEEQVNKVQPVDGEETIKTAVTAVEVSRDRQIAPQPSIYEMMSAIVSGKKPKYSSVEEAVNDYQQRTGLAQYLKSKAEEKVADIANQIVQAAENDESAEEDEGVDESGDEEEYGLGEGEVGSSDNAYADEGDLPSEKDDPDSTLAEIIELFTNGPDDDGPGGGDSPGTLFEIPEVEEFSIEEDAATDDSDANCPSGPVEAFASLLENSKKKV